eukprot:CAMPEP_0195287344 /NCGR_PEP_ID=MMETSP0707-20130614/4443_1 /TAXON_ID=33640 /ORGANISM="Asterionellopsis glacialis, Strain CCMP134" /LENGTH=823 /DNA_ID=CAMNT_0040347091 /DNA_START=120 /DNA_END=2591 /DNA_ORIENTATION=+
MVEKAASSPEQPENPAVVVEDNHQGTAVEEEEQRLRERLKQKFQEKRRKNSIDKDKEEETSTSKDSNKDNNKDDGSKKRKHGDLVENDHDDHGKDDDSDGGEKSTSKNRNSSHRRRRRERKHSDRDHGGRGGGGDNRNGGMPPQTWNRGPPPPGHYRDRGPPPQGWNDYDRGLPPPPHYVGRYGGGPAGPPPRDDWRSGAPSPHPRDRDMWERDRFYDRRGGGPAGPPPSSRYGTGGPGRRSRSRSRDSHSSGSSRSYSSHSRSSSRSRSRSTSRSRSLSRSVSPSASSRSSRSYSSSDDDHSRGGRRGRSSRSSRHRDSPRHRRSRRRSRSSSADSYSSHSRSDSDSSLSSSSTHSRRGKTKMSKEQLEEKQKNDALTKDQRTVFVSQLIMRTTEKDLKRYFKKSVKCKINDVILLKDRRTGRHKGCAYVELRRLEDVPLAIAVCGKPPDFQRFPILVKASEAEKNYGATSSQQNAMNFAGNSAANSSIVAGLTGSNVGEDGKVYESQRAYIGNLDRSVTVDHLRVVFSPFGQLDKIHFQKDLSTGLSRGFAFLQFRDPASANLAIQTMAGQTLVGRPIKTGWANQSSSVPGVVLRTSDEFPDDAPARITNAHLALAQVQGVQVPASSIGAVTTATTPAGATPQDAVASVAEAALDAAFGAITAPIPTVAAAAAPVGVPPPAVSAPAAPVVASAPVAVAPSISSASAATPGIAQNDPKKVSGEPSRNLLVHNMFNKDEETEVGWEEEIRLDFEEECTKYGKITSVTIMSKEPGGKIYATFETIDGAKTCASTLAGRWFDKRQLRVEYVKDEDLPPSTAKKSS